MIKHIFVILFSCSIFFSNAVNSLIGFGNFKIILKENIVSVLLNDSAIIIDSISNKTGNCSGFSFPEKQPFTDYFIFSKHELKNGKTYILFNDNSWEIIDGGGFWVGEKHQLLFINAEREHPNLIVFNIATRKIILEKFNCDEFTDWYYRKDEYFGVVAKECNEEYHKEKEFTEWLHPVIVEAFMIKYNILEEMAKKPKEIEKAKKISYYCDCPE